MKPKITDELSVYLKEKQIWFNINHNTNAMSCCDAASKRNRLGHVGIPCFDELKSNLGYYYKDGIKKYVALHCRGIQKLDINKLSKILGYEFIRMPKDELKEIFKSDYGLINPFLLSQKFPEVMHFFDKSIFIDFLPPYTMMTNAGHHNWGIEFNPKELEKVITNFKIEDLIKEKVTQKKRSVLGILTGNSPESGIMLWKEINDNIREKTRTKFLGDISFPRVVIESIPEMGYSMELELRETQTKKAVLDSIERLCKNGATIIAIACNTTQYFSKEIRIICAKYKVHFISMEEALVNFLDKNHITTFDFLGINYVTDFDKWSDYKKLKENYEIIIPSHKDLEKINQIVFKVKEQHITAEGINKLRDLIKNSTKTGNIIIALTEISILLTSQKKKSNNGNKFYDTLSILAQEVATLYIKKINENYG